MVAAQHVHVAHGAQGISASTALIIGALIAFFASIITVGLNFLVQRWSMGQTQKTQASQARFDQITMQLSELYGPLLLLTAQSEALHAKLCEGKPTPNGKRWRLLDHLAEVVADDTDRALAEQIIDVNARVEELILTKAGLIQRGDVPESFVSYLGHYRFLRVAFEAAKSGKGVTPELTAKRFESYPATLDDDVRRAYNELRDEREALTSGKSTR